ncbi:unnamed protein product, partial [Iphiclides podalirius]
MGMVVRGSTTIPQETGVKESGDSPLATLHATPALCARQLGRGVPAIGRTTRHSPNRHLSARPAQLAAVTTPRYERFQSGADLRAPRSNQRENRHLVAVAFPETIKASSDAEPVG